MRMAQPGPANEVTNPIKISLFRANAVMQIAHPLSNLIENFLRLQRRERADRVVFKHGRRAEIWFHGPAVKREFVGGVRLYGSMIKMFESKIFFSISKGIVGSNAECYADEMLSKLSWASNRRTGTCESLLSPNT
jgi:hypothetical protein